MHVFFQRLNYKEDWRIARLLNVNVKNINSSIIRLINEKKSPSAFMNFAVFLHRLWHCVFLGLGINHKRKR